jgi:protein TonB
VLIRISFIKIYPFNNKGMNIEHKPSKPNVMKTKSKKADLEGKKSLFFQVGLVVALGLALVAFEWPSRGDFSLDNYRNHGTIETPDEVVITRPEEIKEPPPPVIISVEVINIRENDEDIKDDPIIFDDITTEGIRHLLLPVEEKDVVERPIDFMLIEDKPTFMGGDFNTFTKWVGNRLKYPEEAATNGIQGRVILQFLIDTDGSVKNVVVVRGVDRMLDAEALRVVSMSPKWKPGMQRGVPTKVLFTFPLIFQLQ